MLHFLKNAGHYYYYPNRVAIAVGNREAILVVNLHFLAYMGIANDRIIMEYDIWRIASLTYGGLQVGLSVCLCVCLCVHGLQVAVFKITTPNFGFSTGS